MQLPPPTRILARSFQCISSPLIIANMTSLFRATVMHRSQVTSPDYDVTYPTAHTPRMRSSSHIARSTVNVNKVEVRIKYNTNSVPKAHYNAVSITKPKPLMVFPGIMAVTTVHV